MALAGPVPVKHPGQCWANTDISTAAGLSEMWPTHTEVSLTTVKISMQPTLKITPTAAHGNEYVYRCSEMYAGHVVCWPLVIESRFADVSHVTDTPDRCINKLRTLCLKKSPTFKLSLTLSNLNRFSKFLHCWKAYEIYYKRHMTIPTLP